MSYYNLYLLIIFIFKELEPLLKCIIFVLMQDDFKVQQLMVFCFSMDSRSK
jgi:hypothetical protein